MNSSTPDVSPPENGSSLHSHNPLDTIEEVRLLPISENLYLIHSSSPGEGKTRGMAKGLTLCHKDQLLAGECAGFGLPVMKFDNLTVFPSLFSSRQTGPGSCEVVYHLNLMDSWQISGIATPPCYRVLMEKMVVFYMKRPGFQKTGLKIRNALLALFQIRSSMKPGKSHGYCTILYQVESHCLKISINGKSLDHEGELILLNEVPGTGFSRMKSGRDVLDGDDFLPWQPCPIETVIENPALHIGFYLSVPDPHTQPSFQMAAGREVGRALNWAGLAISTKQSVFTYQVHFYS